MSALIQSVIRHLGTFLGGWFVAQGYASQSDTDLAFGAIATLIGFGWSLYEKLK